jgi:hypothetical protein
MMRPSVSGPTATVIAAPVSALPARARGRRSYPWPPSHGILAQMLRHLEHQLLAMILGMQRVQDGRQIAVELDVDDRAQDLGDLAD